MKASIVNINREVSPDCALQLKAKYAAYKLIAIDNICSNNNSIISNYIIEIFIIYMQTL